jgi:hypothetical protein
VWAGGTFFLVVLNVVSVFLLRPEKKVLSILLWPESFITTGKKVLSILLWRESFIMTGKKKFCLFCRGRKVLLRQEKKEVLSVLLWRESFITTGKKSSIYFVVAGKFYFDWKKRKFYLFCCGRKVLLRPEKNVLSILLWQESFITTGNKVLSILLWRESFIFPFWMEKHIAP